MLIKEPAILILKAESPVMFDLPVNIPAEGIDPVYPHGEGSITPLP
jgi:hypothetical protein